MGTDTKRKSRRKMRSFGLSLAIVLAVAALAHAYSAGVGLCDSNSTAFSTAHGGMNPLNEGHFQVAVTSGLAVSADHDLLANHLDVEDMSAGGFLVNDYVAEIEITWVKDDESAADVDQIRGIYLFAYDPATGESPRMGTFLFDSLPTGLSIVSCGADDHNEGKVVEHVNTDGVDLPITLRYRPDGVVNGSIAFGGAVVLSNATDMYAIQSDPVALMFKSEEEEKKLLNLFFGAGVAAICIMILACLILTSVFVWIFAKRSIIGDYTNTEQREERAKAKEILRRRKAGESLSGLISKSASASGSASASASEA